MQAIADRLGGTDRMTEFLRYVVGRATFAPFTTFEFVGFLQDYSGLDMRAQFLSWLYNGGEPTAAIGRAVSAPGETKPEDLDPPWLTRRHGQKGDR